MDYPLNMTKPAKSPVMHDSQVGYAVANDVDEHQALSDAGYEPKLEAESEGDPKPVAAKKTAKKA